MRCARPAAARRGDHDHLTQSGGESDQRGGSRGGDAAYLEVLDKVAAARLDAQISIKPTQLGLDLIGRCVQEPAAAHRSDRAAWQLPVDRHEGSRYVEPTLALYREARARTSRIGLAIQAYLRRTAADVESLITIGAAVRIVKGAYLEPPGVAFPRKADTDENFFRICTRLMSSEAQSAGVLLHIATHDVALAERLFAWIREHRVPVSAYEFAMLYGIQRPLQLRLARQGTRLRVLISYGEFGSVVMRGSRSARRIMFVAEMGEVASAILISNQSHAPATRGFSRPRHTAGGAALKWAAS